MARFPYRGASHLFLIREGKILLSRRFQTGFMDGWYSVPAGHIDGGETARQCVARETLEEIGVTLRLDDIEVVHVMHRKTEDEIIYMDFFATAREHEGEIKNCEPDKCDELSWHALDSVPENTIPYIRQVIDALGAGQFYSEHGFPEGGTSQNR